MTTDPNWTPVTGLTPNQMVISAALRRWVTVHRPMSEPKSVRLVSWDRVHDRARIEYQSGSRATVRKTEIVFVLIDKEVIA